MALPTMTGYWSSRKNVYEQAILRQRNHEDSFRNKWNDTADYFKKSDVRSAKQQAWSSSQTYQDRCMEAYKNSVEEDTKRLNLKRRRDKLALMFAEENKKYEVELKKMPRLSARVEAMKERADELKSAREEKRQKLAEDKLYEHFRMNNPDIRQVESRMLQDRVVHGWKDQVEDRNERLEAERLEKFALEEEMEKERQIALNMEREREEERLKNEKSVKQILKEQMREFKSREAEADECKKQHDRLLRHQFELEQIEAAHRDREEERKRKDLGRALLRQHKAQMMRKSRVIQDELEQDRKLLQSLIEKENEDVALQSARREKARADAQWMKEVLEDQLKLEKAREAELDMLYQDEAARMWQKREAEWTKERQARQRLMSEVLEARQHQITERLSELQHQQEESLQRREELVREMELAQQMTKREVEEADKNKQMTKAELEEQIRFRKEREWHQQQAARADQEENRKLAEDYEDLLRQETDRMKLNSYTPRDYSRKQAWS